MKKKFLSLFLAAVMCVMSMTCAFANSVSGSGKIEWTVTPQDPGQPSDATQFVSRVLGALQGAGMIVGIFILIFFGFKYLTAGAGEKAKTKEMMVPFLVGAAVVMLAPTLAGWVFKLANP